MKGPTAALLLSTLAFPSSHTDGFRVRRPGRLSRLGGNTMMAHRIGVYYGTVGQNTQVDSATMLSSLSRPPSYSITHCLPGRWSAAL